MKSLDNVISYYFWTHFYKPVSTKTQSILVKNKYKQKQVIIVMVYNVFSSKSDW